MREPVCMVVGAGEFRETALPVGPRDLLIAADGGADHLRLLGRVPDVLIGDMDSLTEKTAAEIVRLPREKDDTDMRAALRLGWERSYRRFRIYGGLGGRLDHTLANLQCLADISTRGGRACLLGDGIAITAVTDGVFELPHGRRGVVSVFAVSDRAEGVGIRGLRYELEDAQLTSRFPIGVSNESDGTGGRISVTDGTLLILYPRGEEPDEGGDF